MGSFYVTFKPCRVRVKNTHRENCYSNDYKGKRIRTHTATIQGLLSQRQIPIQKHPIKFWFPSTSGSRN